MTQTSPIQPSQAGTDSTDQTAQRLIEKSDSAAKDEQSDSAAEGRIKSLARAVTELPTARQLRVLKALERKLPKTAPKLEYAFRALSIPTAPRSQHQSRSAVPAASTPLAAPAAPKPADLTAQQLVNDSMSQPQENRIKFLAAAIKRTPKPVRKSLGGAIDKYLVQNGRDGDRKLLSYALGALPSHETLQQLRQTARQLVKDNYAKLQLERVQAFADAVRSHPEPERKALEAAIRDSLELAAMPVDSRLLYRALHGRDPSDYDIMKGAPTSEESAAWFKREFGVPSVIERDLPARASAPSVAAAISTVPPVPDRLVDEAYERITGKLKELETSAPAQPKSMPAPAGAYAPERSPHAVETINAEARLQYQVQAKDTLREIDGEIKSLPADKAKKLLEKFTSRESEKAKVLERAFLFDSRNLALRRDSQYFDWSTLGSSFSHAKKALLDKPAPSLFQTLTSRADGAQMSRLVEAYDNVSQDKDLQASPQGQALASPLVPPPGLVDRNLGDALAVFGTPDYRGDIIRAGMLFVDRAKVDERRVLIDQLLPKVRPDVSYPPFLRKNAEDINGVEHPEFAVVEHDFESAEGALAGYAIGKLPKDAIVQLFEKIDGREALLEAKERYKRDRPKQAAELARIEKETGQLQARMLLIAGASMQPFRITRGKTEELSHGADPAPLTAMIEATTSSDPRELLGKKGSYGDRGRVVLGRMLTDVVDGALMKYVDLKYYSKIPVAQYHLAAANEPAVQKVVQATLEMIKTNPLALMAGLHSMHHLAHGQTFQEFGVFLMDDKMMKRMFAAKGREVPLIAPPNPKVPGDRGGPLYEFYNGLYGNRTGAERTDFFFSGWAPGEPGDPDNPDERDRPVTPPEQFEVRRGLAYATGLMSGISTLTRNLYEQEMAVLGTDQSWVNALLANIPAGGKIAGYVISPAAKALVGQDVFITATGIAKRSQYLGRQLNATHFYLLDMVTPTNAEAMQSGYYDSDFDGTEASVPELVPIKNMMNNTFWSGVAEGQRFSNVYTGVNHDYQPGEQLYDEPTDGIVFRLREEWQKWVRENGRR